jgi:hypothetical protein
MALVHWDIELKSRIAMVILVATIVDAYRLFQRPTQSGGPGLSR